MGLGSLRKHEERKLEAAKMKVQINIKQNCRPRGWVEKNFLFPGALTKRHEAPTAGAGPLIGRDDADRRGVGGGVIAHINGPRRRTL